MFLKFTDTIPGLTVDKKFDHRLVKPHAVDNDEF
jgi:hypothetical protein